MTTPKLLPLACALLTLSLAGCCSFGNYGPPSIGEVSKKTGKPESRWILLEESQPTVDATVSTQPPSYHLLHKMPEATCWIIDEGYITRAYELKRGDGYVSLIDKSKINHNQLLDNAVTAHLTYKGKPAYYFNVCNAKRSLPFVTFYILDDGDEGFMGIMPGAEISEDRDHYWRWPVFIINNDNIVREAPSLAELTKSLKAKPLPESSAKQGEQP